MSERPSGITLQAIVEQAHKTSVAHGWWSSDEDTIPAKLLLIHSEVSEAVEAYCKPLEGTWNGKPLSLTQPYLGYHPEGFVVELADIIIRVADIAGYLGLDLTEAMLAKLEYNKTRPARHGGKRI